MARSLVYRRRGGVGARSPRQPASLVDGEDGATEAAARGFDRCVQVAGGLGSCAAGNSNGSTAKPRPMRIYEGSTEVIFDFPPAS